MSTPIADVLIVGGGPAGLSAALTLVRQRHSALLFDMAKSRALPSGRLYGTTMQIHFTDNTSATEYFLGHAAMISLNGPFASQLGINVSQSGAEYVVYGPANQTNIEGIYAAGDAMTMLKVWPSAIASGSVTAAGVAIALREERCGLPSTFA